MRNRYSQHDPRDRPTYSITEAALSLGMPPRTLQVWFAGQRFETARGTKFSAPLLRPADPDRRLLSFWNLVEAHLLMATRVKYRVPMKAVRTALEFVAEKYPSAHPLLDNEFHVAGRQLFVQKMLENSGPAFINASRYGQLAIEDIVKLYLERIGRDADGYPSRVFPLGRRIRMERPVLMDYQVVSGRLVITGTRILASVIRKRHLAGEAEGSLAADYNLPELAIRSTLEYFEAA